MERKLIYLTFKILFHILNICIVFPPQFYVSIFPINLSTHPAMHIYLNLGLTEYSQLLNFYSLLHLFFKILYQDSVYEIIELNPPN